MTRSSLWSSDNSKWKLRSFVLSQYLGRGKSHSMLFSWSQQRLVVLAKDAPFEFRSGVSAHGIHPMRGTFILRWSGGEHNIMPEYVDAGCRVLERANVYYCLQYMTVSFFPLPLSAEAFECPWMLDFRLCPRISHGVTVRILTDPSAAATANCLSPLSAPSPTGRHASRFTVLDGHSCFGTSML